MKKIFAALAATVACSAFAVGPYDGIYVSSQDNTYFLSVHQNGGTMIATVYSNLPASGVTVTTPIGVVSPPVFDYFELYNGPINGTRATLSGGAQSRSCTISFTADFTATNATITVTGIATTAFGTSQRANCAAAYNLGSVTLFPKLF